MKRSLSCISPDGKTTFSFCSSSSTSACIGVQFLPVTTISSQEKDDDEKQKHRDDETYGSAYTYKDNPDITHHALNKKKKSTKQQQHKIILPESIVCRLNIDHYDSAIGLVYCDSYSLQEELVEEPNRCSFSSSSVQVALYSQSVVWLLEIGCNGSTGALDILSVVEPFENYLLSLHPGSKILRVRSSPRDTLAPPGSLAMLTTEGSLVLYHPGQRRHTRQRRSATLSCATTGGAHITVPVSMSPFLSYDDNDADGEVLTDFCFGIQNKSISFLDFNPSMGELSVLFLCQNGNVYGAAPVVFDFSAIQTSIVEARIQWIKNNISELSSQTDDDEAAAQFRMYSAALHWTQETFSIRSTVTSPAAASTTTRNNNPYSTAQLFRHGNVSQAWPLQIQGPLVDREQNDATDYGGYAVVIEPLPSSSSTTSDLFVIGKKPLLASAIEIQVDVYMLAVPVLPRFSFESIQDRDILDDYCMDGIVLETVLYDFNYDDGNDEYSSTTKDIFFFFLEIVVDPVTPYMIHAGNSYGVCTISLESIPMYLKKLIATTATTTTSTPERSSSSSTYAWSCLFVDSEEGSKFDGVVVSEDAQFGHILIAHLTNDQVEVIDITASKYLSQVSRLAQQQQKLEHHQKLLLLKSAHDATETLESIPPFSASVAPLIQSISNGLTSMGRLVGSTTKPCDADGTTLATLLQCKNTLETKVVLPLKELYTATRSREKQLHVLYDRQKEQLQALVHVANSLKEQTAVLQKKVGAINKFDEILSQRAASVLERSRKLLPTITEKESEYFTQLKRWEKQSNAWEEQITKLTAFISASTLSPDTSSSSPPLAFTIELSDIHQRMCRELLAGQELLLSKNKVRLNELEHRAKQLIAANGLKQGKARIVM